MDLLNIGTARECLVARSTDDHDFDIVIKTCHLNGCLDILPHSRGQSVTCLRPVECQIEDPVVYLIENIFKSHVIDLLSFA